MFVSWCARQAGVPTSVLQNSACAGASSRYFNISYYDGKNYRPKAGDLFFTKSWSHVGLVERVEGNYFYTIEGNSNSSGSAEGTCVCTNKRYIPNFYFGVPNYKTTTTNVTSFSTNFSGVFSRTTESRLPEFIPTAGARVAAHGVVPSRQFTSRQANSSSSARSISLPTATPTPPDPPAAEHSQVTCAP